MSMFILEKECPHCQAVVSLGGYQLDLEVECVCPKCQQRFYFGNLTFDTGEILKLTYAQSARTSSLLVRANYLLDLQHKKLKDIGLFLFFILVIVPIIGALIAASQS